MAETKRYLDAKGLNKFWTEVKKYYSSTEDKIVDNASAANKLANSRVVKLNGDVTGKAEFDGSSNATITAKVDILGIEDHEIKKMFGKRISVSNPTDLISVLSSSDLASGSVVKVTESMELPSRIEVVGGKDITIEIEDGVVLTTKPNDRFLSVKEGSTVEICGGGTINHTGSAQPLIFCYGYQTNSTGKDCTVILDGVTCEVTKPSELNFADMNGIIYTNGSYSGANVVIKSGTFRGGIFYFAAGGSVAIEGGEFECPEGPVIYVKRGLPLTISGGRFESKAASNEGKWAHWNNGCVSSLGAVMVEACNYGGAGNPIVNITGGEFIVPPVAEDAPYKNYGIMIVDWDGNKADMSGTTVSYQHAEVTGHTTTNGSTEPSDGWYYFNDDNTTFVEL